MGRIEAYYKADYKRSGGSLHRTRYMRHLPEENRTQFILFTNGEFTRMGISSGNMQVKPFDLVKSNKREFTRMLKKGLKSLS